jgi:hypothetical protein
VKIERFPIVLLVQVKCGLKGPGESGDVEPPSYPKDIVYSTDMLQGEKKYHSQMKEKKEKSTLRPGLRAVEVHWTPVSPSNQSTEHAKPDDSDAQLLHRLPRHRQTASIQAIKAAASKSPSSSSS